MSQNRTDLLATIIPEIDVINLEHPVDLQALFPGLPTVVDFGAGMGHHTVNLARDGYGVLAIDVHTPGICAIAQEVLDQELNNIRVHLGDGWALLTDVIAPGTVDELHVLFPDPWPKARHHKRRLIQSDFLTVALQVLTPVGTITVVTDDDSYADHVSSVVHNDERVAFVEPQREFAPTKYHERGLRLGHSIHRFTIGRLRQVN